MCDYTNFWLPDPKVRFFFLGWFLGVLEKLQRSKGRDFFFFENFFFTLKNDLLPTINKKFFKIYSWNRKAKEVGYFKTKKSPKWEQCFLFKIVTADLWNFSVTSKNRSEPTGKIRGQSETSLECIRILRENAGKKLFSLLAVPKMIMTWNKN